MKCQLHGYTNAQIPLKSSSNIPSERDMKVQLTVKIKYVPRLKEEGIKLN